MTKQKQNVESQLEFAKLALESLNGSHSGSNLATSVCQTLDISKDVVGAKKANKTLRRKRLFKNRR
jgi:hypothetical protein